MNKKRTTSSGLESRRLIIGISVLIFAFTWLIFGQTLWHDFINYDDQDYVFANAEVVQGLTGHGILWAFTGPHSFNWHPLTSLSHMLDCQIFGLNAGGHHFTSVLLHAIAAIFLFLVLRQMTGRLWESAFVATIFAIHPLRVESVAWIAERKDVLSGLFFFLTLGAYVRYVREPGLARYLAIVFAFGAGLMSKPMLVTLPALLLLLDYWPLNRFPLRVSRQKKIRGTLPVRPFRQLVIEKLPLFALSAASSFATIGAQHAAVVRMEQFPFRWRVMNAFVSYIVYLWQMFVPGDLTILYPLSVSNLSLGRVTLSAALLVLITVYAVVVRRSQPYVFVGWLWYLLMLLPVIGLMQVGSQAHADRYTYLPQIGIYIALTWSIAAVSLAWRQRRPILIAAAALSCAVLATFAWKQTAYWRDSETAWQHAIAINSRNDTACKNLGDALLVKGRYDDAIGVYEKALLINTRNSSAENGLGSSYLHKGITDQAIDHYHRALQIRPEDAEVHSNLGNALCQNGSFSEGIVEYRRALQLRPDSANLRNAETQFNLGNALLRIGDTAQAIDSYRGSLKIQPNDARTHDNLATSLIRNGEFAAAMEEYRRALGIDPRSPSIKGDFAWALATCPDTGLRNGRQAVDLAEQARDSARGFDPVILRTLAAAYAETGDFQRAIDTAQKASALASEQGNSRLTQSLDREITLYRAGSSYRPR